MIFFRSLPRKKAAADAAAFSQLLVSSSLLTRAAATVASSSRVTKAWGVQIPPPCSVMTPAAAASRMYGTAQLLEQKGRYYQLYTGQFQLS